MHQAYGVMFVALQASSRQSHCTKDAFCGEFGALAVEVARVYVGPNLLNQRNDDGITIERGEHGFR